MDVRVHTGHVPALALARITQCVRVWPCRLRPPLGRCRDRKTSSFERMATTSSAAMPPECSRTTSSVSRNWSRAALVLAADGCGRRGPRRRRGRRHAERPRRTPSQRPTHELVAGSLPNRVRRARLHRVRACGGSVEIDLRCERAHTDCPVLALTFRESSVSIWQTRPHQRATP